MCEPMCHNKINMHTYIVKSYLTVNSTYLFHLKSVDERTSFLLLCQYTSVLLNSCTVSIHTTCFILKIRFSICIFVTVVYSDHAVVAFVV